jgi:hypothetical protein
MSISVGSRLYAPLIAFLHVQARSTTTVTVTLAELEQAIGQSLPRSGSTPLPADRRPTTAESTAEAVVQWATASRPARSSGGRVSALA